MTNDEQVYRVVEEKDGKRIERVVSPIYSQTNDFGGANFLTLVLLAPFYVIGAILALPALVASNLMQTMASGGFALQKQPRMLVTEIVRDENGRIVEVVERVV